MALTAATILKLQRRFGATALARMTRRDTYILGDATYGTIDEDALEDANEQARQAVQQVVGAVDEDHWAVFELTPYFLGEPGDDQLAALYQRVFDTLRRKPVPTVTSAVAKDADTDRRRFDGEDYDDLRDVQARNRPGRSTF